MQSAEQKQQQVQLLGVSPITMNRIAKLLRKLPMEEVEEVVAEIQSLSLFNVAKTPGATPQPAVIKQPLATEQPAVQE